MSGPAIPSSISTAFRAPNAREAASQTAMLAPIIQRTGDADAVGRRTMVFALPFPEAHGQLVESDNKTQHEPDQQAPGGAAQPLVEQIAESSEQDDGADERIAGGGSRS